MSFEVSSVFRSAQWTKSDENGKTNIPLSKHFYAYCRDYFNINFEV